MKNKGFTLIELLAVIVILAIIALIATPIILGIINDSKKQSSMRSAELYLKAAELAIARENINGEVDITSCDVITDITKSNFEGSKTGDLSCNGKLVKVDMDKDTATSGTITFINGKLSSVTGLTILDSTYKTNSTGSLVIDDNSNLDSETGTFTGTIYRNTVKEINIGDSIAPVLTGKFCGVVEGIGNSCDFEMSFDSVPECETAMAGYDFTCVEEVTGLLPGEYYTDETKSNITTNVYLKHDVVDDIVTTSYACMRYSGGEACVKGLDLEYYGTYDGMSSSFVSSVTNPSGNIAIIDSTSSYFLSNSGTCSFNNSSSSCYNSYFHISSDADGYASVIDQTDNFQCNIKDDGPSRCSYN